MWSTRWSSRCSMARWNVKYKREAGSVRPYSAPAGSRMVTLGLGGGRAGGPSAHLLRPLQWYEKTPPSTAASGGYGCKKPGSMEEVPAAVSDEGKLPAMLPVKRGAAHEFVSVCLAGKPWLLFLLRPGRARGEELFRFGPAGDASQLDPPTSGTGGDRPFGNRSACAMSQEELDACWLTYLLRRDRFTAEGRLEFVRNGYSENISRRRSYRRGVAGALSWGEASMLHVTGHSGNMAKRLLGRDFSFWTRQPAHLL